MRTFVNAGVGREQLGRPGAVGLLEHHRAAVARHPEALVDAAVADQRRERLRLEVEPRQAAIPAIGLAVLHEQGVAGRRPVDDRELRVLVLVLVVERQHALARAIGDGGHVPALLAGQQQPRAVARERRHRERLRFVFAAAGAGGIGILRRLGRERSRLRRRPLRCTNTSPLSAYASVRRSSDHRGCVVFSVFASSTVRAAPPRVIVRDRVVGAEDHVVAGLLGAVFEPGHERAVARELVVGDGGRREHGHLAAGRPDRSGPARGGGWRGSSRPSRGTASTTGRRRARRPAS